MVNDVSAELLKQLPVLIPLHLPLWRLTAVPCRRRPENQCWFLEVY